MLELIVFIGVIGVCGVIYVSGYNITRCLAKQNEHLNIIANETTNIKASINRLTTEVRDLSNYYRRHKDTTE